MYVTFSGWSVNQEIPPHIESERKGDLPTRKAASPGAKEAAGEKRRPLKRKCCKRQELLYITPNNTQTGVGRGNGRGNGKGKVNVFEPPRF